MPFTPVRLSQRDPRWKDDKLGTSSYTLGTSGCAVASVAMLLSGFGINETPGSLNAKLKNAGGFMDAAIVWGAVGNVQPKAKFRNIVICRDSDAPLTQIDAALAKGQPVLVEVDSSPSAGLQTHWVVLYARQGNDYLMLDPWPYPVDNSDMLLMTRYSHGKPLKRTITAAVWYEVQDSQVNAPPNNLPSTTGASMLVRVVDGLDFGLRLRSAATINSDTLAYEMSGTFLAVLDPLDIASPKIGIFDQWLRVRDPQGLEGYVAAWYVEKSDTTVPITETPAPPAPPPAQPPVVKPAEPALSVFVSQDVGSSGLRLRASPSSSGILVKVLKAGQELTALEPANSAKTKVGKQDQWLKVRDGSGDEGYVAAWLVTLTLGAPPAQPVTPPPVPTPPPAQQTTEFAVQVSAAVGNSGLRLRKLPSPAGLLLAIEPVGTRLVVLESAEQAKNKIGKENQWLNVRDPQGKTGFVAAWFVELPKQTAPLPLVSFGLGDLVEAEPVTVHVSGLVTQYGGLNLRAAPLPEAQILAILPAYLPLELLEPAEAGKTGKFGEWLHVRTPEGLQGYVAAWYIEKS